MFGYQGLAEAVYGEGGKMEAESRTWRCSPCASQDLVSWPDLASHFSKKTL